MEMSTVDCGKKQSCRQSDMSDSSRYLYGHLPPDIMSKGLPNNGNDTMCVNIVQDIILRKIIIFCDVIVCSCIHVAYTNTFICVYVCFII